GLFHAVPSRVRRCGATGSGRGGASGRGPDGREGSRARLDLQDDPAFATGIDAGRSTDAALRAGHREIAAAPVTARRAERVDELVDRAIGLAGRVLRDALDEPGRHRRGGHVWDAGTGRADDI